MRERHKFEQSAVKLERYPSTFLSSLISLLCPLVAMSANGHALAALQPGHFLFTSESVGEGHPGM